MFTNTERLTLQYPVIKESKYIKSLKAGNKLINVLNDVQCSVSGKECLNTTAQTQHVTKLSYGHGKVVMHQIVECLQRDVAFNCSWSN